MTKEEEVKDRVVKQVSFSLTDKFEDELLQFALEQGTFSKYMKRLIFLHKSGMLNESTNLVRNEIKPQPKPEPKPEPIIDKSDEVTEKKAKNMTSLFNIN